MYWVSPRNSIEPQDFNCHPHISSSLHSISSLLGKVLPQTHFQWSRCGGARRRISSPHLFRVHFTPSVLHEVFSVGSASSLVQSRALADSWRKPWRSDVAVGLASVCWAAQVRLEVVREGNGNNEQDVHRETDVFTIRKAVKCLGSERRLTPLSNINGLETSLYQALGCQVDIYLRMDHMYKQV